MDLPRGTAGEWSHTNPPELNSFLWTLSTYSVLACFNSLEQMTTRITRAMCYIKANIWDSFRENCPTVKML